ncbi:MAG: hypothetical protein GC180_06600 [Bacteroidetes bacterium]|nr:hypothetical protein [Bacteroidota bacterium]
MENKELLASAILQTLSYFDYFKYPLNADEIHRFLEVPSTPVDIQNCLLEMMDEQKVSSDGTFYSLYGKTPLFERRKISNALAMELIPRAKSVGRFLYRFPFVRFVGISGSLSKLYADEKTDFDFFIVTAPNRLWIARSFMHAFKKLSFLFNKQEHYCMNYYLDSDHLQLEDRNRYTSIELSTLIPVVNSTLYKRLIRENFWLKENVPNFHLSQVVTDHRQMMPVKFLSEFLINLFFPSRLNHLLMRITDIKWKRKWQRAGYPMEDYDLAFRTREYISKNHPKNYQKRVLTQMDKKRVNVFGIT